MLSIIISSYQKQYYDQLVENISATIGDDFAYEIIQIWNPNLMSITKAYNLGAEKSQYDYLLFLHEDVIFHDQNWGEKLLTHLNMKDVGIVGIAGSSYIPSAPSSWPVAKKYDFVNIFQGNKENKEYSHQKSVSESMTNVFSIDGVFIAIKKDVYEEFKFDESLHSFHGYDLDFSLRVAKKFQNFVVDNILLQHFSNGNLNKDWFDANVSIKEKIKISFNQKIDSEIEKGKFIAFLSTYFNYYPVNYQNILFTRKFYPTKINFSSHKEIIKKYLQLVKYSKFINKNIKKL